MPVPASAESDAQHLLGRLGMTEIPVDPIKVARALRIRVWTSDLDENVAGVLVQRRGDPEILISAIDPPSQQRFTVAHEVGHFIERAANGQTEEPLNQICYRDDVSPRCANPAEMYANEFAAALLMPEAELRGHWERDPDADNLAGRFQVSPDAMRHRLGNLGLR